MPNIDRANKWLTCTHGYSKSYIEPILLESGEDSPIYREVMRTGVAV